MRKFEITHRKNRGSTNSLVSLNEICPKTDMVLMEDIILDPPIKFSNGCILKKHHPEFAEYNLIEGPITNDYLEIS